MKPRLWRNHCYWWCQCGQAIGTGLTPADAYLRWALRRVTRQTGGRLSEALYAVAARAGL